VSRPGRTCPTSYRYRPEDLAGPEQLTATTLLVAGCLYGNVAALEAVMRRAAQESATVVLNGDIHYLDADEESFRRVGRLAAGHPGTLGNVEAGLVQDADGADDVGCGCAYPDYVDDATVERSNAVTARLHACARRAPEVVEPLSSLPRHLTVGVGGLRVGVIHGDPESLSGWGLALEAVEPGDAAVRRWTGWSGQPTTAQQVADWFRRADVDVLACTHTGLPYAQDHDVDGSRRLVLNNGAAGLPAFPGGGAVVTRLSTLPGTPADSLYGTDLHGVRCDALHVRYDTAAWRQQFRAVWPPGSPGHASYAARLEHGTPLRVEQCARGTVQVTPAGR
jgi:hypothetical protein